MNRLEVKLGNITLKNPIIPASGTFGFGYEMSRFYDINILGAISLKGTTLEPRFGNPTPRIAECEGGMLNAVGLQNPGIHKVIGEEIPRLRHVYSGPLIANISGFSIDEYRKCAKMFGEDDNISILEINISCPNVRHGGMAFGTSPAAAAEVVRAVKEAAPDKPAFIKLSPNVTDIAEIACACAEAGADGLVLINTLLGMRIDPRTGRPIVSTEMAGFSGPAIKPVAVRMICQVCRAVGPDMPVIGVGGAASADDVLEMMWAGASAVEIGSQNLVNPYACRDIIEELLQKLDIYKIGNISDIIGKTNKR